MNEKSSIRHYLPSEQNICGCPDYQSKDRTMSSNNDYQNLATHYHKIVSISLKT